MLVVEAEVEVILAGVEGDDVEAVPVAVVVVKLVAIVVVILVEEVVMVDVEVEVTVEMTEVLVFDTVVII